ncbi:hypothetical protein GZH46_02458 [Fragariocoptes setiger]|uniref:Centrosome-associated FAM110 C-terminal domain-containing protein n=1 Tax=Fragariocoptes setiger TaxID=1670756 RepID=A0ABQ7S6J1_9ACAR|nr:hypothetical protein GZH46_02458 [Fragariocoptes setiger]
MLQRNAQRNVINVDPDADADADADATKCQCNHCSIVYEATIETTTTIIDDGDKRNSDVMAMSSSNSKRLSATERLLNSRHQFYSYRHNSTGSDNDNGNSSSNNHNNSNNHLSSVTPTNDIDQQRNDTIARLIVTRARENKKRINRSSVDASDESQSWSTQSSVSGDNNEHDEQENAHGHEHDHDSSNYNSHHNENRIAQQHCQQEKQKQQVRTAVTAWAAADDLAKQLKRLLLTTTPATTALSSNTAIVDSCDRQSSLTSSSWSWSCSCSSSSSLSCRQSSAHCTTTATPTPTPDITNHACTSKNCSDTNNAGGEADDALTGRFQDDIATVIAATTITSNQERTCCVGRSQKQHQQQHRLHPWQQQQLPVTTFTTNSANPIKGTVQNLATTTDKKQQHELAINRQQQFVETACHDNCVHALANNSYIHTNVRTPASFANGTPRNANDNRHSIETIDIASTPVQQQCGLCVCQRNNDMRVSNLSINCCCCCTERSSNCSHHQQHYCSQQPNEQQQMSSTSSQVNLDHCCCNTCSSHLMCNNGMINLHNKLQADVMCKNQIKRSKSLSHQWRIRQQHAVVDAMSRDDEPLDMTAPIATKSLACIGFHNNNYMDCSTHKHKYKRKEAIRGDNNNNNNNNNKMMMMMMKTSNNNISSTMDCHNSSGSSNYDPVVAVPVVQRHTTTTSNCRTPASHCRARASRHSTTAMELSSVIQKLTSSVAAGRCSGVSRKRMLLFKYATIKTTTTIVCLDESNNRKKIVAIASNREPWRQDGRIHSFANASSTVTVTTLSTTAALSQQPNNKNICNDIETTSNLTTGATPESHLTPARYQQQVQVRSTAFINSMTACEHPVSACMMAGTMDLSSCHRIHTTTGATGNHNRISSKQRQQVTATPRTNAVATSVKPSSPTNLIMSDSNSNQTQQQLIVVRPLTPSALATLPGASSDCSIVDKNARIIKWLYGCRAAMDAASTRNDKNNNNNNNNTATSCSATNV